MDTSELDGMDPVSTSGMTLLINGNAATFKRMANDKSEKNLRLRLQPDGQCASQLGERKQKLEEWANKVIPGHLLTKAICQSYTQQVWSSMTYKLGTCTASLKEVENSLGLTDFYLIIKLSVAQRTPRTLIYIPYQFCGMELNSLPAETTVAQINCPLQQYGPATALKPTLKAAIEHLQVEIDVPGCSLLYDYYK